MKRIVDRHLVTLAVTEYLQVLGIHHTVTPPYYPPANQVERVNRTLKTRLIVFVEENHTSWDVKLPKLVFSLNNASHCSTGLSRAILNYGRQLSPGTAKRAWNRVAEERASQERVGE